MNAAINGWERGCMCGIAGLVRTDGRACQVELLGKMTDLVSHRGPDGQGFLLGETGGRAKFYGSSGELASHEGFVPNIGLGHRRLSILDLTLAGRQPMSYQDGNYWLVFNGEIYNYVELEEELRPLGYVFHTRTDSEVIMAAYDAWGEACVERFNGMWAFALWDVRRARLFCSRDRWGIKPFSYRWQDGCFAFGSEIKQLVVGTRPQIALGPVFDYAVIGATQLLEETCFAGVFRLRGGHCLSLDLNGGSPRIWRFYEPKADPAGREMDLDAAVRNVGERLSESIRIRMRSDVPVGSCLSGGLDSSVIVSMMSRLRPPGAPPQHAFSFVSVEPKWDESRYADMVAKATGVQRHAVQPSCEEVVGDVVRHLWHQDEPVNGLSPLAQWNVFKAARAAGVPVLLDGQGGDEAFLGYEWYYGSILLGMLRRGAIIQAIRQLALSATRSGANCLRQLLLILYFQMVPLRAARLRRLASAWLSRGFLKESSISRRLGDIRKPRDLEALQVQELSYTCLPELLRYEDRNSMAFSVETRLPMLDYRVVELAMGLPWDFKIREGWTKYVLRQLGQAMLPHEVAWRRSKFGFAAPEQQWMDLLRPQIDQMVRGDLACAGLVDVTRLRKGIAQGVLPDKALWRFFNLEHWMRLFSVECP